MLQNEEPNDFVIATGKSYSVKDFMIHAFSHAELDWEKHVRIDERYVRPSEVHELRGDASKAKAHLGWQPTVNFDDLVSMMVDHDLDLARRERMLSHVSHEVKLTDDTDD